MTVIHGEIIVNIEGDRFHIKEGDVLAFPGNQAHSYKNPLNKISKAISIVIPIPV